MGIRPSPIAGTWYPSDPVRLKETIERCLAQVDSIVPDGRILGLLAPHAGYRYSGVAAAYAYQCVRELHPKLVVVLSPFHAPHNASLLTTPFTAYRTPLGLVPVDHQVLNLLDQALQKRVGCDLHAVHEDVEHAVEIELPFLQHLLGEFKLVPVMINDQRPGVIYALGAALAELLHGRSVLIVASSDLSHFYPQVVAEKYDAEMLRRVAAFDPDGVLRAEQEGVGFACGRGALAAMLITTKRLGANRVQVLHYATSGDITGDRGSVVGYGAAVVWQELSARS